MEEAQQGSDGTESQAAVTPSILTGSYLSQIAAQQVNKALCSSSQSSRVNTREVNQLFGAAADECSVLVTLLIEEEHILGEIMWFYIN